MGLPVAAIGILVRMKMVGVASSGRRVLMRVAVLIHLVRRPVLHQVAAALHVAGVDAAGRTPGHAPQQSPRNEGQYGGGRPHNTTGQGGQGQCGTGGWDSGIADISYSMNKYIKGSFTRLL